MYVRVRDRDTLHEFDVRETDKRIGVSVDLVKQKRYPPSPTPRRAKHHIKLAGRSASRESAPRSGAPVEATDKENPHD